MITSFIVFKMKGAGKLTANGLTTKPAFGDPEVSITEPHMLFGKNRFWETAFQTCDLSWRQ
jgi:hypothetical protein